MVTLLALALMASVALADEGYYLESPPLPTRAEALEIQQLAQESGINARVVRRYEHGSGWEYLVVAEGFTELDAAQQAAAQLAQDSGQGITVYEGDETGGRRLNARAQGWTGSSLDPGAVAVETPQEPLPTTQEILAHAVRALGGEGGGEARLADAEALTFRYERSLDTPAGRVQARHDLAWEAGDQRLRIQHIDGPGVDATMLVRGEEAWVYTEESGVLERDPEKTREVLADFGPDAVLFWPLGFAQRVADDPAFDALRVEGLEEHEGRQVYRLETIREATGESFQLLIDAERWTITQVSFRSDAGDVRYNFSDWRELDTGLVVPFEVILSRDGTEIEHIRLIELSLLDALPEQIWGPLDGEDDPFLKDDPESP
ncbi:MAG: hypothetical protein VX899_05320 [Myxococcota bacterium]|nr:hypothetical protein [Myxococcota bacterium]